MGLKKVITDSIDLLFKTLTPEELSELKDNPWDPEFSLEDAWLETMNIDLDLYSKIRYVICNFGYKYFLEKF